MTPAASGTWLIPKITVIDKGSAIEKPMNEPKVTTYKIVIDQVCLFLKISNCLAMLPFISPKAAIFMANRVTTMIRGNATHMLSKPRPVGAGRYRYRPNRPITPVMPQR